LDIIWAGIAVGSLYAIVAIVFTVILGQTGIFNFAASQPLMIGAMLSYVGLVEHQFPVILVVAVAALAGAVVSFLVERVAVRPLKEAGFSVLVTTVGASVVIQGVAIIIWDADAKYVPFPGNSSTVEFLGGTLQPLDIGIIVVALALAIGLHIAARHTPWGLAGRATTENEEASALRGTNIRRVVTDAFLVSGFIAGAVGPLAAGKAIADVAIGTNLVIYAFIAMAIGGFGSYLGCLLGGVLTGVIQLEVARHYDEKYSLLILVGLVLIILLTRPNGLFGQATARMV
jgi:branched-chain amino acid transport system permease protein